MRVQRGLQGGPACRPAGQVTRRLAPAAEFGNCCAAGRVVPGAG